MNRIPSPSSLSPCLTSEIRHIDNFDVANLTPNVSPHLC